MRIEELARRIAAAPRAVVIALLAFSVLISPGLVRVSPNSGHGLEPQTSAPGFSERKLAVFALKCRDGVFTKPCLRLVARVTEAIEAHADVAGSVRSLANAHIVRARYGALRLESLSRPLPESDAALRDLRGRLRSDDALLRRFVSPDGYSSFVYAELLHTRPEHGARALADSLREAFDRPPALAVTLVAVESEARGHTALVWLALALGALALGLAPGGWRAASLAVLAAVALGAFAHVLLGLVGASSGELAGFAPALLAASALSASFALIARARVQARGERFARAAVASALAAVGPSLAMAAFVSASGLAALLLLDPAMKRETVLGAAAALAVALVAYPLGIVLTGAIAWPRSLASESGEFARSLSSRVERGLVRSRLLAGLAIPVLALAAFALAGIAPRPGDARLERIVLDSGVPGGALEPAFLERVQIFQREVAERPGVVWASSLVDRVLVPANRALHDGDPLFASVPLTRFDVERALHPWQRADRRALGRQIDREQRRVSVELLLVPSVAASVPLNPHSLASTWLAIALVGGLGASFLRSVRGGLICALTGALTGAIVLGLSTALPAGSHGAGGALAPLSAAIAAGLGLQFLARARALIETGAQPQIATALALREVGPSVVSAALASSSAVLLVGAASRAPAAFIALACLAPPIAAWGALVVSPLLARVTRGRFFSDRVSRIEAAGVRDRR